MSPTFSVGDEVFGISKGSFAEYAAAKASKLAHKPADLTFEQAAVVPVSSIAAWQAVHDAGRVEAGQRVLVIGASGGVGSYAVQLAVAFGAEVTGVASTAKLDLVRSLGAAHVVDYTREDWSDRGPLRRDHRHRREPVAAPAASRAHARTEPPSSPVARRATA